MFVFFQIFGDVLGDKNVSGISASHHPLRDVEAGASEISVTVHIDDAAHRAAVHAHPKFKAWMLLARPADLNRRLRGRFLTCVENERHAVAGWNFYQATGSFGFLILIRTADDC